ncbi:MAG: NEAT domain-containing protein [Gemella sp.]|nr:NEAT domain-containing protein [Gemella sp.]
MKNTTFRNKTIVSLVGSSILFIGAGGPIIVAQETSTENVESTTTTVQTSTSSVTTTGTTTTSTTSVPTTTLASTSEAPKTETTTVQSTVTSEAPVPVTTTSNVETKVVIEIADAKIGQNWKKENQIHLSVDTLKFDIVAAEKEVKEYYLNGKKLEKYTDVSIARWDGMFRVENKEAVATWKETGGNEFKLVFNDGTEYVYKQPSTGKEEPAPETTTETTSTTTQTETTTTTTTESTSVSEIPKTVEAPKVENSTIEISSAQVGKNWKKEDQVEFSIDKDKYDIIAINNKVKEYYFNGKKLEKFLEISVDKWDGLFRIENKELVKLWKEAGENELKLVFDDGTEYVYKQPSTTKEEPAPETTTSTTTSTTTQTETTMTTTESSTTTEARVYPDFTIKTAELYSSYGEKLELNLTVIGYQAHTRILKDVDYYEIDGVKRDKSELGRDSEQGKFGIMNQDGVQAWKESKDKVITLVMKDGQKITFSANNTSANEAPKTEETTTTSAPAQTVAPMGPVKRDEYVNPRDLLEKLDKTLADQLEDGEYTIGFSALRADGKVQSSMLEGFFDENVKLVVKDGKKHVEMLNTMFADGLLDFRLQNKDGSWSESTKENYGEPDINNKYKNALFTIPVENVEEEKLGAVLVSYMGGKDTDKGDVSKYARLLINFKTPIYKGFDGYDIPSKAEYTRVNSDRVLNRRLKRNAELDADQDGTVTAEELKDYKGDITIVNDLSDINDTFDDYVYNYSILKNAGPNVNSINISTNKITELPVDAFANATGLKEINLASNGITTLPEDLFKNNPLLEKVQISSNKLASLPSGLFKNNPNIKEIDLSQTGLVGLDKNIFASLPNLERLYLNGNSIAVLPEELFTNNTKLTHLNLDDNGVTKLPTSIGNLVNLQSLSVNNGKLNSLPEEVKNLKNLKVLNLKQNNISQVADEVWQILADNKAAADLSNNNLSKLPVEVLNGKINRLNLSYNNLPVEIKDLTTNPEALGLDPERIGHYFPQKTATSLSIRANEKEVAVKNGDLTLLDLVYWYWGDSVIFGGKGVLQTKDDYIAYKNEEMKEYSTDLAGVLNKNKSAFKWIIDTVVERDRQGVKTLLSETSIRDKDDENISIRDEDMQNGDVYTVRKVLSLSIGASHKITPLLSLVESVTAKVEDKKEVEKSYKVPVKLLNLTTRELSMGNAALDSDADVIEKEDGTRDIVLHFKSIQMGRMKGNILKLAVAKSLDDAKNSASLSNGIVVTYHTVDGQELPKSIRISNIGKDIKEIPARVWVDAMERIAQMSGRKDGSQPVIILLDGGDKVLVETSKGEPVILEALPEAPIPNITSKGEPVILEAMPEAPVPNITSKGEPVILEALPEAAVPNITSKGMPVILETLPEAPVPNITSKGEALVQEELPTAPIPTVTSKGESVVREELPEAVLGTIEIKEKKKEEYKPKVVERKTTKRVASTRKESSRVLPKTSASQTNTAIPTALSAILIAAGLMTRRKEK